MTNWNLIRGAEGTLSAQDIRRNILSYIIKNHPASLIQCIEKEYNTYRIDILGSDSLLFDLQGQFVKANIRKIKG
ncbi:MULTISPECIES: hypothetical protein [Sphingobacterium]|uniref:Uncharacterized protein n=1 Tax=Sphingobacterium athyrii TaxID=2152717 RepID=A0A363NWI4_9SPHI|nr:MULTISPECIES: hypothetical protein [Sphingobacterium]PUV25021.1 hypothetical protein DCO56_08750 [Sphingobacterium athyrii]QIH34882.1 hypothetical protein G6053_19135 [Sphingobacterium sp. DR205]